MDQVAAQAARPLCDFFSTMGADQLRAHCIANSDEVGYFVIAILVLAALAIARQSRSY